MTYGAWSEPATATTLALIVIKVVDLYPPRQRHDTYPPPQRDLTPPSRRRAADLYERRHE